MYLNIFDQKAWLTCVANFLVEYCIHLCNQILQSSFWVWLPRTILSPFRFSPLQGSHTSSLLKSSDSPRVCFPLPSHAVCCYWAYFILLANFRAIKYPLLHSKEFVVQSNEYHFQLPSIICFLLAQEESIHQPIRSTKPFSSSAAAALPRVNKELVITSRAGSTFHYPPNNSAGEQHSSLGEPLPLIQ